MEKQKQQELSEHQKYILSQMINSDSKTIEEIGLIHQKQLSEIFQNKNVGIKNQLFILL